MSSVTRVDAIIRHCLVCKQSDQVLERVPQLHEAIALGLVGKRALLDASEIDYLSRWFDNDLAAIMGVKASTLTAWRSGAEAMDVVSDRLLRVLIARQAGFAFSLNELRLIKPEPRSPMPLTFKYESGRWQLC